MANEQDNTLVIQFSDMIHTKAQQINARLRPLVRIKKMSGDKWAYDGLGQVEAREVVGRIQPTVFDSIDHLRREIKRRRFTVTLPIDSSDVRGSLLNYDGEYAAAVVRALERVFDRVGIEAVFADVKTGRNFETTVTAASDGVITVDATSGLTYEKLLELNKNYTNNEVGTDLVEEKVILMTGDEEYQLMQEIELTSGDYTRQFVVEQGEIQRALGNRLVKYGADVSNPLLAVASTTRDCVSICKRGLCYGMSVDTKVSIEKRPDYIETTQVQAIIQLGAVRTEGVLVQKLQTTLN